MLTLPFKLNEDRRYHIPKHRRRAVFRLALRRTEGLIEKRGTKTRRSWRTLRTGLDADTGQIVAAVLTRKKVDDGCRVGPLLDQVVTVAASFTADGAYDLGPPR